MKRYFKVEYKDGSFGLFDTNDNKAIELVKGMQEGKGNKIIEVTKRQYAELEKLTF